MQKKKQRKGKPKADHTVYDALELWGYAVWVFDEDNKLIEHFAAGDSRCESQRYGTGGLNGEDLLDMARDMAVNMHQKHGGQGERGVRHEDRLADAEQVREVLSLEHSGEIQTKLAAKLQPPQEFPFGRAETPGTAPRIGGAYGN